MLPIFKKRVIFSVDSYDLAKLIREKYGKDPEIEACLEIGHDETVEIEACGDEYVEEDFISWKQHQKISSSEIYMLLNKLAYDGIIEDGNYLIETC